MRIFLGPRRMMRSSGFDVLVEEVAANAEHLRCFVRADRKPWQLRGASRRLAPLASADVRLNELKGELPSIACHWKLRNVSVTRI